MPFKRSQVQSATLSGARLHYPGVAGKAVANRSSRGRPWTQRVYDADRQTDRLKAYNKAYQFKLKTTDTEVGVSIQSNLHSKPSEEQTIPASKCNLCSPHGFLKIRHSVHTEAVQHTWWSAVAEWLPNQVTHPEQVGGLQGQPAIIPGPDPASLCSTRYWWVSFPPQSLPIKLTFTQHCRLCKVPLMLLSFDFVQEL